MEISINALVERVDGFLYERGALTWMNYPDLGRIPVPRSPMRYHGSEQRPLVPSRRLGEDNRVVYGEWLGLSSADIDGLEREGVI